MNEYIYSISPIIDNPQANNELRLWINIGTIKAETRNIAKRNLIEQYKTHADFCNTETPITNFNIKTSDITYDTSPTWILIEQSCCECQAKYRIIDRVNSECRYTNTRFCSILCEKTANERKAKKYLVLPNCPSIYKITNKVTGLAYVGRTNNTFTLRWHTHFFTPPETETKFTQAIRAHKVTDWIFEIIEIVDIEKRIKKSHSIDSVMAERERFWIKKYNTINNGYNSLLP